MTRKKTAPAPVQTPRDEVDQRCYLQRIKVSREGYDSTGAYWGAGAPVYCAYSLNGDIMITLRARDRVHAIGKLRVLHPHVKLWRE